MKILYAIQATGNGHISRASQIMPHLKNYGKVDTFLSGSNYGLNPDFEVTYKSKGISFFYNNTGNVNFLASVMKNSPSRIFKDIRDLPVENYDFVINDFEFISSQACKNKKVPCYHFGHQASFLSKLTPRAEKHDALGEFVLKNLVTSQLNIGLHFKSYDKFIYNPIIDAKIATSFPEDKGHITIYLPSIGIDLLTPILLQLKDYQFHLFDKNTIRTNTFKNITYYKIDKEDFIQSLVGCHGLITGAGFETPSEALYLNKKLMCIAISNQYEQLCNAAALSKLGVMTLNKFDANTFSDNLKEWIVEDKEPIGIKANNIYDNVGQIVNHYERSKNRYKGLVYSI